MPPAIRVENLSKLYRLGNTHAGSLRELISGATSRLLGRRQELLPHEAARAKGRKNAAENEFWALRDVSFEVQPGEIVGIIGRNGAGKSTLLKILSRITSPTHGHVAMRGRVASLLEVGTGFHPELTGRENVFLNGAILGMTKAEIRRKFDEIVNFAEIEKFIDTPVKRYSSGMYVRLAFAVAAHLEPEILIIDEVLAVGDVDFQRRCLQKMATAAASGYTIIFVSHNMAAIRSLCNRGIIFREGQLAVDTTADLATSQYLCPQGSRHAAFDTSHRTHTPLHAKILDAAMLRHGRETDRFLHGDVATVRFEIEVHDPITFGVEMVLRQFDGTPIAFTSSGLVQDWEIASATGHVIVTATTPSLDLAAGEYSLDLVVAQTGRAFLDYVQSALRFTIEQTAIGVRRWTFQQSEGRGALLWNVLWSVHPHAMASDGSYAG
jgi:lipopolysaccharide transport system ATP-binding protein